VCRSILLCLWGDWLGAERGQGGAGRREGGGREVWGGEGRGGAGSEGREMGGVGRVGEVGMRGRESTIGRSEANSCCIGSWQRVKS
jgi:hypothetical protein